MTSSMSSATMTPLLVVSPPSCVDANNHPFTTATTTCIHLFHAFNYHIRSQHQLNSLNYHSSTKALNHEPPQTSTTINHKCRFVLQHSLHDNNHITIFWNCKHLNRNANPMHNAHHIYVMRPWTCKSTANNEDQPLWERGTNQQILIAILHYQNPKSHHLNWNKGLKSQAQTTTPPSQKP